VLVLSAVAVWIYTYLNSNYPADAAAMAAMESTGAVTVTQTADRAVLFLPEEPEAGFVFYPGGKVDHLAYAPLMQEVAGRGIACVLLEMPFDLAVLDVDAAVGAKEMLPEINRWFIGGHSLGGAMAAACAAEHTQAFDGLVLLAAYSTKDLRESGLKVVSLYGSEDEVLDLEQYGACRENLPADAVEEVLEGGNHAGFGSYGSQKGDGAASVYTAEQIAWAADLIEKTIAE